MYPFYRMTVIMLAVIFCTSAFATVRILDNNSNSFANFTTAQAAHNGSNPGDTIMAIGSTSTYGDVVMTKQLYWIGCGYYVYAISPAPYNINDAMIGTIYFNSGSGGTVVEGFNATTTYFRANGVTLKKCWSGALYVDSSNCVIQQCYNPGNNINVYQNAQNTTIRNCIYGSLIISDGPGMVNCFNNYFVTASLYRTSFYNNYVNGTITLNSNASVYNCMSSTNIGSSFGNISSIPIGNVFVNTGSSDRTYQLRSNPPTTGAGFNGGDIGPYGGPTPYVLSGRSFYPTIETITTSGHGTAATGLQITVSAQARN